MSREVNVPIRITVDQQAAKKSDKAIAKTRGGVDAIAEANERVAKTAQVASKSMKASYAGGGGDQAVRREVVALQSRNEELRRGNQLIEDYDKRRSRVAQSAGKFGDIDTSLSTFGSAASAAGAGGAATAITGVADIAAVREQLPLFKEGVNELGTSLAKSKGPVGALANAGAGVASVLPGVSAGFGAVAAVALPLAAIAGAGALALNKFNKAQEKVAEQARKDAEVITAREDAFVSVNAALRDGDQDAAIALYAQSLEDAAAAADKARVADQNLAQARQEVSEQNDRNNLGEQLADSFTSTAAEKRGEELKKNAEEATQAAAVAAAKSNEIAQSLESAGISTAEIAANNNLVAEKERELDQARKDHQAAIADLTQQESDLLQRRRDEQAQVNADRAIRDRRADEDAQEQKEQHIARLAEIQADGDQRIEDIASEGRDRLADLEASTQEQIAEVQQAGAAKIVELQQQFQKSEIEAEKDYREERKRIIDEANQAEFDAILNNDVVAAAQARRREEEQLANLDQEFAAERAAEQQAIAERVAAIQQENAQRIAEIRNSYAQERVAIQQQTQERIEAERAAIAERIASERKAAAEAEAQRQKQLQRQAEDDKRQDEQREARFKQELARIEQAKQAEIQRFQEVQRQNQQAINDARRAQQAAQRATEAQISGYERATKSGLQFIETLVDRFGAGAGGGGSRTAGPRRPVPQASGGIMPANRRIVAEFERERPYNEMVLPLTPASVRRNLVPALRAAGGGGGGPQVSMQVDMTVGDIASGQQVREALTQVVRAINQANGAAVQGTGV